MALGKFWVIAFRDLGRNRRRSITSLVAVALGLALVITMSGYIAGVIDGSLRNSIELRTGHVQLRSDSYKEEKLSLLWDDLVDNLPATLAQVRGMSQVEEATPQLWTSGVLSTIHETTGLRVIGIDPASTFPIPLRESMVAGEFLSTGDRGAILVGKRLADNMGLAVGQRVNLITGHADGRPVEETFTIQGLFATGIPGYDDNTVFMTLSQAQGVTGAGDRASVIVILLHNMDDADQVAEVLNSPEIATYTWRDLNSILLESLTSAMGFYNLIYGIVFLVVAVIIANTLLMVVFERTREIGILAAMGMKKRQIMFMFLLEAAILAMLGILVGILLGSVIVLYFSSAGIPIGDLGAGVEGIALSTILYPEFVPADILSLSVWTLVVILLAALYPSWFAARLEPVGAIHSL